MSTLAISPRLTSAEQEAFRAFAEKDHEFMQVAAPMVQARFEYKILCQELANTNIETVAGKVLEKFIAQNTCSDEGIAYLQRKVSAHAKRYSPQIETALNEAQIEQVAFAVEKFAREHTLLLSSAEGATLDKEQTALRKNFKAAAAQLIIRTGDVQTAIGIAAPFVNALSVGQATKEYMVPYKIDYVNKYEVKKS